MRSVSSIQRGDLLRHRKSHYAKAPRKADQQCTVRLGVTGNGGSLVPGSDEIVEFVTFLIKLKNFFLKVIQCRSFSLLKFFDAKD